MIMIISFVPYFHFFNIFIIGTVFSGLKGFRNLCVELKLLTLKLTSDARL